MASAASNSKVDSIFIGLLQIRLQQESSGCAAAEHHYVWVRKRFKDRRRMPRPGTPFLLDREMSLLCQFVTSNI